MFNVLIKGCRITRASSLADLLVLSWDPDIPLFWPWRSSQWQSCLVSSATVRPTRPCLFGNSLVGNHARAAGSDMISLGGGAGQDPSHGHVATSKISKLFELISIELVVVRSRVLKASVTCTSALFYFIWNITSSHKHYGPIICKGRNTGSSALISCSNCSNS